ncbi:hypothetical protein AMTR_s00001p00212760 [Amborella trichopoda]|uniref:Uncharacterized protein n=1 Tax=Amborella trichopoda TaxID=13333 RepID=W1NM56_AMBTC|nr:hypothetical protein AMTR_s00001p00212760 [Amborella trichopoda]
MPLDSIDLENIDIVEEWVVDKERPTLEGVDDDLEVNTKEPKDGQGDGNEDDEEDY